MLKQILRSTYRFMTRSQRRRKLNELVKQGLPQEVVPAIELLITECYSESLKDVISKAETRREQLASLGNQKVPIMYSPKPKSSDDVDLSQDSPSPGETLYFTMEKIAHTGKNKLWASVLNSISTNFKSNVAIELGACAGLSAIYLADTPHMKKLITVEGSEALAKIAKQTVKNFDYVSVVNSLFDEAIDREIQLLGKNIDLAYIDGHHEKLATIHYYERLKPLLVPHAIVIFDDISWSSDMWEAWQEISAMQDFEHCIDLGTIGVCILKADSETNCNKPQYWNIQEVIGKHKIGSPRGWS